MNLFVLLPVLLLGMIGTVTSEQNADVTDKYGDEEEYFFETKVAPSENEVDADPEKYFEEIFDLDLPEDIEIQNYEYSIFEGEPNYFALISCDSDTAERMTAILEKHDYYLSEEPEYAGDYLDTFAENMEWWELDRVTDDIVIYENFENHYVHNCKCLAERYVYILTMTDGTKSIYASRIYPEFFEE